jgi:hypothetical protein
MSEKSWQLQQRIWGVSGVGSCSREFGESPELAVAAENLESLLSWQLQQRIEGVSGVGSCSRELRESPELAVAAQN